MIILYLFLQICLNNKQNKFIIIWNVQRNSYNYISIAKDTSDYKIVNLIIWQLLTWDKKLLTWEILFNICCQVLML